MPTKKSPGARTPKPSDADQVAAWMAALDHPLKPGIDQIREVIMTADPGISERIKWNAPSYHLDGTDFVTFGPRRDERILLVFHHPAIAQVSSVLLEGDFKDRRLAWFGSMEEIAAGKKELDRIVNSLIRLIKS